eukprot:tig00000342_g24207.t1
MTTRFRVSCNSDSAESENVCSKWKQPSSSPVSLPNPSSVFGSGPPAILRIQLLSDPPVEGCEITPYVLLSNVNSSVGGSHHSGGGSLPNGASPLKINGTKVDTGDENGVRYRWYRCLHRRVCSYPACPSGADGDAKAKYAKLQCAVCAKLRCSLQESYFCSVECFQAAWPKHKYNHPPQALAKHARPWNRPLDEMQDEEDAVSRGGDNSKAASSAGIENELDGGVWLEVGRSKIYVPVREDVGRVLKFEVAPVTRDGTVIGRVESIETSPVLPAPPPPPERRMVVLPSMYSKPVVGTTFKFLTYNVLAEIYAGQNMYPYCPGWALGWNYRKKNLIRELLTNRADIMCLQEVQCDAFEDFFRPEMSKYGYDAVYKQKTREAMGADGKMDGCSIFFKRDRFALRERHVIEYNQQAIEHAAAMKLSSPALNRMLKDNVGVVVVLEVLPDPTRPQPSRPGRTRDLICVANTHVYWDPDYADVKLWQTHVFLQEVERICRTPRPGSDGFLPVVIGGDFNSLPDSGVHELLARGRISPNHPDLSYDTYGILGAGPMRLNLSHNIQLRDVFAEVAEELPQMPKYTNFTGHFVGEIDYVLYTPDRFRLRSFLHTIPEEVLCDLTALPSQQFSSDHISLLVEFEYFSGGK